MHTVCRSGAAVALLVGLWAIGASAGVTPNLANDRTTSSDSSYSRAQLINQVKSRSVSDSDVAKKLYLWVWSPDVDAIKSMPFSPKEVGLSIVHLYHLDKNGTFNAINPDREKIQSSLKSAGYETLPLVAAQGPDDNDKQGLANLLALIDNPAPFIRDSVARAVQAGFDGYNVDFELPNPNSGGHVTQEQLEKWWSFLNQWADSLHAVKKKLTVETQWCYGFLQPRSALTETRVDRVVTMDTYVDCVEDWSGLYDPMFSNYMSVNLQDIGPEKLGLGLYAHNNQTRWPEEHIGHDIDTIIDKGCSVREIWVWTGPFPEGSPYYTHLRRWLGSPLC